MKKLILLLPVIILLSLTSTFSLAERIYHEDDLIERNGVFYDKSNERLATGTIESYYSNGRLEGRGRIKNGKLEGVVEYFDRNGRLTEKEFYRNGELVKTKRNFAKKTKPERKVFRRNGIWYRTSDNRPAAGTITDYWENGNLESKVKYRNGRREGIAEYYDRSGRLTRKEIYRDGELIKSKEY